MAIGSAILFFNFVTSYGEANIKAPTAIAGNYLITAQNLPACLQQKQLLLKLQQSGIYLNASLINNPKETISDRDIRPTLSGKLRDRQLELIGLLPTAICPQSLQLQIVGSLVEPAKQLEGKLWFGNQDIDALGERLSQQQIQPSPVEKKLRTAPVEFTSILQPSTRSAQSH
ncbi:hypothetical protein [Chamaesiphon sp. VAR_48_metabat_135_sub]|uniref:hypothetical protein n=1 Tax=Chamaesiphon sp. VAR_48_metabat_135_sub TaxID=2964699 RepID=UPI00286CC2C1|nr:hypothetical protein [Chamaesiphon sp. VAR_48_metabat_135_sub]